jgi:hypothetical protein
MKTALIALIGAIALTHAAQGRDWALFRGDIGLDSPFVSPRQPTNSIKPAETSRNAAPNRAGVKPKAKSLPSSHASRLTNFHSRANLQISEII